MLYEQHNSSGQGTEWNPQTKESTYHFDELMIAVINCLSSQSIIIILLDIFLVAPIVTTIEFFISLILM